MTKRRSWTAESVLEVIKERRAAALPLSSDIMDRTCAPLIGAARRLYGNWSNALEAAGIDPEAVKVPRKSHSRWSREKVIERIREHAAAGHDLAAHRLAAIDAPLVASAPRYCDSWDNALQMAGFDPAAIRLTVKWTAERVVDRIRELNRARADLSDLTVEAFDGALYGAASTHYGGWRQAVVAAGLDYDQVRRIREDWTREALMSELRRMHDCGVQLSAGCRYLGINKQIQSFFGGISGVHQAIGEFCEEDSKPVACHLRKYREAAGKSQTELGKQVGRSHRSIGLYESGIITPPLGIALQIAAALGESVHNIWEMAEV